MIPAFEEVFRTADGVKLGFVEAESPLFSSRLFLAVVHPEPDYPNGSPLHLYTPLEHSRKIQVLVPGEGEQSAIAVEYDAALHERVGDLADALISVRLAAPDRSQLRLALDGIEDL